MLRRPAPPPTGWARTAQSLAVFAFEVVLISLVLLRFHLAPLKAGFAALCAGLLAACAALLCAVVAFQVIVEADGKGIGALLGRSPIIGASNLRGNRQAGIKPRRTASAG